MPLPRRDRSPHTLYPVTDRHPLADLLHPADDGMYLELAVPGGRMGPSRWTGLAAAAQLGDGRLHLATYGRVQLRGLDAADSDSLLGALDLAALLPDAGPAHTVLTSALAGRLPGHHGLGDTMDRFVAEIATRSSLAGAAVPAGFLFGLDDGRGEVARHAPDLGVVMRDEGTAELVVGGAPAELLLDRDRVPELLADLAEAFVGLSGAGPRLVGDDRAVAALLEIARGVDGVRVGAAAPTVVENEAQLPPTVGWVDTRDETVSLLAVTERGEVDARLAEFLGAIETETTISADRVIGIHGLSENQAEQVVRVLAPMGLIFDAASPWAPVRD